MFVIPSIDILNGKCVQLIGGRIETAKVYGTPLEYFKKWISKGADIIHVIDLDAAFNRGSNKEIVFELRCAALILITTRASDLLHS